MGEGASMILMKLHSCFFLTPSPALTIPFPPDNKFPNKEAPKVPKNIDKNPPFCSLVSLLIFLATPFNKIPEFLAPQ